MADEGGAEFAARVRRVSESTGADFWAAVAAVKKHGPDEAAACEELSRLEVPTGNPTGDPTGGSAASRG